MAVSATLSFNGLSASAAYIRMARLYGGRGEAAWTGIFQLYASESVCYPDGRDGDPLPSGPMLQDFLVSVPYQSADPRPLLFAELKTELPDMFGATNLTDV